MGSTLNERPDASDLDAYLEKIVERAEHLRTLDLATEHGRLQALEESQNLLAAVAMYRHALKDLEKHEALLNL